MDQHKNITQRTECNVELCDLGSESKWVEGSSPVAQRRHSPPRSRRRRAGLRTGPAAGARPRWSTSSTSPAGRWGAWWPPARCRQSVWLWGRTWSSRVWSSPRNGPLWHCHRIWKTQRHWFGFSFTTNNNNSNNNSWKVLVQTLFMLPLWFPAGATFELCHHLVADREKKIRDETLLTKLLPTVE